MSDNTPDATAEAVVDLLGMLAHGEMLAFDRMAADARLAPDMTRRAMLSEMAGYEIANYQRIASRLEQLGADPATAMAPFRAALDDYHEQTEPKDWLEALTKAYVGDGIADDFIREVVRFLGPADRRLVLDVLHDSRYANFAAEEIRRALAADPGAANRLSMWARRLVGEAITQAQRVAAKRPSFARLISNESAGTESAGTESAGTESAGTESAGTESAGTESAGTESADHAGVAALLQRLTSAHVARMEAIGLNN